MTNRFNILTLGFGLTCSALACSSQNAADSSQAEGPAAAAPATAQPAAAAASTPTQPAAAGSGSVANTPAVQAPATTAPAPAANSGNVPADPAATAGATPPPAATAPVDPAMLDHTKDIRGHCGLKTNFADDNACIPAPKPGEGIQIHVGPSNYDDPAEVAKYIMKPGEESSECFNLRTSNTEKVVYQSFMLSGRAGTHHMINTLYSGGANVPTGSFGPCGGGASQGDAESAMPIGSLPGASKAYMARSAVAPEYAHVGRELAPNALLSGDMHYFNFTDKDILREVWLNLYFAPEGTQVTELSDQIRGFGGLGWNREPIPPGTDMVYKYECPIMGAGKIMSLLGHYHAHGKRFTASLKRASGTVDKVFEMFDYLDPATFDYNSITTNPMFAPNTAGALSGVLDVADGDVLQWECHIINDSNAALAYTNEVKTGEMCNIWGYSIGTNAPITCDLF
jgi:hypothetical protein